MFICELCGKETPLDEIYVSEQGLKICEECAKNQPVNRLKPIKLSKKEIQKLQLEEEKERELNEKRRQIAESRRKYAEANGFYVGDLTIDELRKWNDVDATIAAGYIDRMWNGNDYNMNMYYNHSSDIVRTCNSQIIIRQNEEIIRLLRALLEK